MYSPYAAPRRHHTNGTDRTNTRPVRPFSVSYGATRSLVRYASGCVASSRTSRTSASHGAPPG